MFQLDQTSLILAAILSFLLSLPENKHFKNTVGDLYSECVMVAELACIFLYKQPVLQDKCQSRLTEGTVWDNTLAMAPVLIHASKEPDGEVKVSVQILFLEWGVYSLSLWSSPDLSASTSRSVFLTCRLRRSFVLAVFLSDPVTGGLL